MLYLWFRNQRTGRRFVLGQCVPAGKSTGACQMLLDGGGEVGHVEMKFNTLTIGGESGILIADYIAILKLLTLSPEIKPFSFSS